MKGAITLTTFFVCSLTLGFVVGTLSKDYFAGMACVLIAYVGGYLRAAWEYDPESPGNKP